MLHIRFEGRSYDFTLDDLNLSRSDTDDEIRMAVAQRLDVGIGRFEAYVIER